MAQNDPIELPIDDFTKAELIRVRDKIDSISGPYVTNKSNYVIIGAPAPSGKAQPPPPPSSSGGTGQYQFMIQQMVAQNVKGWGYLQSHSILE